MTRIGVSGAALLIALLVGCGGRDLTIRPDATRPVATTSARPPAVATPAAVGDFGRDLTCSGDVWPPVGVPDAVPGLTARSTDRAHLEIRNGTDRPYHARVSGWQIAQLESCRGLVEREVARGPVAPGAAFIVDLPSDLAGVPITVGIWTERCGEACSDKPKALLFVSRSMLEPASS